MHKEDCPNLDPEQIMAIDCTYVYWTRSKERLFFSYRMQCSALQQENGGLLATNNLAVPKELYALRKQKNDDDITLLLLLGRLGAILPPLKKIGGEELLLLQLFFGSSRAIAIFSI